MKDYYYILGVKESASFEEIESAYRKLSKKFHPDKNPKKKGLIGKFFNGFSNGFEKTGDKFFEDRFMDIQEGYETLSDSHKRKIYDNEFSNQDNIGFAAETHSYSIRYHP